MVLWSFCLFIYIYICICQEQKVIDFDDIESHSSVFSGLDVGYCCLGTTRGKSGKVIISSDYSNVCSSNNIAPLQYTFVNLHHIALYM